MRTHAPLRAVAALLVAALWSGAPIPVAAQATDDATAAGLPACTDLFAAADAIADAVRSTGSPPASGLTTALLDLTIAHCAGRNDWLAVAPEHLGLLDGSEPSTVLVARCSAPDSGLAAAPACETPRLVRLPSVTPTVKGAQRTRTYPIEGRSPDELFTQMQVKGSAGCPTHAVACTNIQPRIQPLVTTRGGCRVIGVRASLLIEAVVPRWAAPDRVFAELAAWWRLAAKRIGTHEATHVRIANRHLAQLRRGIIGKPCSALQAYVTRWSQELTAAQDDFDRADTNRPWPPYDGPLP